jgi:hypothetical protein
MRKTMARKGAKTAPLSIAEKARLAELEAIHINTARHIFDCGTRQFAAERFVRIIERKGWPCGRSDVDTLIAEIDLAGPQYACQSITDDDDVPF